MAVRYAVATGNWSNTATWNGGTLPTSSDDVYANGFTVTINGTFTVLSIRSSSNASPVIAAGGQFIYANGGDLTCTAAQAIVIGSITPTLEMNLASPNTATFRGSNITNVTVTGSITILLSSNGTLNLIGNYSADGSTTNSTGSKTIVSSTGNGTLNIVGDLNNSSSIGGSQSSNTLSLTGGILNLTGNVSNSSTGVAGGNAHTITSASATVNITGNITNLSPKISISINAGNLNVTGNTTGGSTQPSIFNQTTTATISVTGTVTAGTGAPAIYSSFALTSGYASGTYVKVSGNVINSTNNMAIIAPRVTIDSNTSSWLFQTSTGGTRTLYAAGVNLGNPLESNVRLGTVYGTSNELTGTMNVPPSSVVLKSVPVDNTTGTLLMTPSDVWNYLISSGFTLSSIGDRLQNTSTVSTTGGQIASYNI